MTSEHKEDDVGTSVVNGVVLNTTGQERDLDPPKVCTGKGAVTLWASPINEDNLSTSHTTSPQDIQPSESAATGKTETDDWRLFPSVDSDSDAQPTALAAKGYRSVRPNLLESKPHDPCPLLHEAPRTSSGAGCYGSFTVTSKPSSAYPSTTIVNPTIVLLQHNREQQKRLSSLAEPVSDAPAVDKVDYTSMQEKINQSEKQPTEEQSKVVKSSQHMADSLSDDIGIPLRNTDRSKDWYKTMFKQIHRLTKDEDSDSYFPQFSCSKDTTSVPRSKSENDTISPEKVVKRSATLPLPNRSSSLKISSERNDWEPPDKKVDTRKYRAEPKSIYEYQPGRSSVLTNENLTDPEKDIYLYQTELEADIEKMEKLYKAQEKKQQKSTTNSSLETIPDHMHHSSYSPSYHPVKRDFEAALGDPIGLEKERHIYKSVLEGGDIPLQGLSGLKRPSSSASTKVDLKGGNAPTIAPSPVNSRTFNSSSAGPLGHLCKNQKPLPPAAKVCMGEILPSKFKPRLATLPAPGEEEKDLLPHEKTQSCENLHSSFGLFDNGKDFVADGGKSFESPLMKSKQAFAAKFSSTQSLQEYGSSRKGRRRGSQKNGAEFTTLYKNMHHIDRSGIQLGSVSSCSVKEMASLFENEMRDQKEPSPGRENVEQIPKHTVSSRVTAFELLIQRSLSMPALNASRARIRSPAPSLSNSCLGSMYSIEYELSLPSPGLEEESLSHLPDTPSHSCSNTEDARSELSEGPPMDTLFTSTDEIDLLSDASTESVGGDCSGVNSPQRYKTNKCKGSCPASYTRFTTIRRHEQQQFSRGDVEGEKQPLPRNVYLMSPLPFRLKKPLPRNARKPRAAQSSRDLLAPSYESQSHVTNKSRPVGRESPLFYELCVQQKPAAPERLSSYDIVQRVSHFLELETWQNPSVSPMDFPTAFNNGNVLYDLYQHLDTNNNPHRELRTYLGGGLFVYFY